MQIGLTRRTRSRELIRRLSATRLVVATMLLQPILLCSDPIQVRYVEGTARGFLVLRAEGGKVLAAGDLEQKVEGGKIVARTTFHFQDGSLDDEMVTFSQSHVFRLLSDHHIQRGPAFPHPLDMLIEATSGQVTLRSSENGKERVDREHFNIPTDLANGILAIIVQNLKPNSPETKLSFLTPGSKPRLIKLSIKPQGQQTFRVAGYAHKAIKIRREV